MAGALASKLQAEIKWLATQVPEAPLFMPHVTLLGGIHAEEGAVLATAASLAKQLKVRQEANGQPVAMPGALQLVCSCLMHFVRALLFVPQPYRITFDRVASGAFFHQCVYLLCQMDHGTLHVSAALHSVKLTAC